MKTINLSFQKALCAIIPAMLLFTNCKKELNNQSITVNTQAKNPIPAYLFNWETADDMPVPPGGPVIHTPWANGSTRGFPSDIQYDFKSSDGWQLVYNAFDPTQSQLPANPFFILYNRYRGLLRVYVYVTTGGFTPSSYVTDGLIMSGPNAGTSPMLNYIGQDLIDVNVKHPSASVVEQTQVATGTWYAGQYEIAYDGGVAGSTYQQLGVAFTLGWQNITAENLTGLINGQITGTITTPSSQLSTLFNTGAQAATSIFGLSQINTMNLNATDKANVTSILTGAIGGNLTNFFSALIGGNSNNVQQVNLTINAGVQLSGTSTSNGAVIPSPGLQLGLPGTSNSQSAPGLIPHFNDPMGVFYLSAKPKIHVQTNYDPWYDFFNDQYIDAYDYNFTGIDQSSYNIVFNPAVINASPTGAHIENLKQEMLHVATSSFNYYNSATSNLERVGKYYVYTQKGTGPFFVDYIIGSSGIPSDILDPQWSGVQIPAIRISFDVVSNDGLVRTGLVKTFNADVEP